MGFENMMETSTRSARNRRIVAILGWMVLVSTSIILLMGRFSWIARLLWVDHLVATSRTVDFEPTACILAVFAAFVGVFAWLLFNPGRRSASESPVLFFAAAATLFPPPIIAFCLMPIESPGRAWVVAFGIFTLCVIAVLSHVPDDFFGVPRGRSSYMTPIPTFDSVDNSIMNPDAAWFTFEDLTRILPDAERPSLAPRSYLQQETGRAATTTLRGQDKVASEVDDILGSDFDLGLLDDDFTDIDRPARSGQTSPKPDARRQKPTGRTATNQNQTARQTASRQPVADSNVAADDNVFESFDRMPRKTPSSQSAMYLAASASQTRFAAKKRKNRQTQMPVPDTGLSVRDQLKSKNRQSASGHSGMGLSSSSRQSFKTQNQAIPPVSKPLIPRREEDDSDIGYGTLDVHRGQQPNRSRDEDRSGQSTDTSRQQDRLAKERADRERADRERAEQQRADRERADKERAEQQRADRERADKERAEQQRADRERADKERADRERERVELERRRKEREAADQARAAERARQTEQTASDDSSTESTSSQRLSRYEQRQQQAKKANTAAGPTADQRDSDRKLTRQGTSHSTSDATAEDKPKRRSALDIATAGILGAGVAAQATSAERDAVAETSDLDSAASQGLFGTVRDLFSKPKKPSDVDTTLAEDFDAAVESVQAPRNTNRDVAIERTIDASGAEMVEGVAVVRFERGQKKANVHIPFSPPLKGNPEVEVECVGDEQLRLKVPMAEPYGMRIEARRSNTSESMEAEIGFAAMAEEE